MHILLLKHRLRSSGPVSCRSIKSRSQFREICILAKILRLHKAMSELTFCAIRTQPAFIPELADNCKSYGLLATCPS